MNGTSAQSLIAITAYSVTVNNSSGIVLSGDLNIATGGALTFSSGDITTSSNKVVLNGTASISGETSDHYVIGQLQASTTSTSSSFGGSGVSLTLTGGSGGTVTMNRYTGTAVAGNGNTGLQRWADLSATSSGYSSAQVVLTYFDSELGTIDPESSMKGFNTASSNNETDGSASWSLVTTSVNTSANTITVTGLTPSTLSGYSFSGGDDGQILPIVLLGFSASSTQYGSLLSWSTSTETDNSGFEIQRSVDGQHFEAIGFVAGAGNSINELDYSYTDMEAATLAAQVLYYRLKQIDFNGDYSYSPVQSIQQGIGMRISWQPNPASSHITLAEPGIIAEIVDLSGRVQVRTDGNIQTIGLDGLLPGVYLLRLRRLDGSVLHQDRLVKQ
ncbi:MAG: T9SS type A sorting domain-containing protein [Bacteroidetes bacterium]|nr:T9SS type A sorting domain-containing protein [Bacteroidota bacterium]